MPGVVNCDHGRAQRRDLVGDLVTGMASQIGPERSFFHCPMSVAATAQNSAM